MVRKAIFGALLLAVAGGVTQLASAEDDDSLFGIDLGIDTPLFRIGTDAALFERPRYGGDSRLFVRDPDQDGRYYVYRGPTYQQIVETHPDLGAHAGIEVLGQRIGADVGVGSEAEVKTLRTSGAMYVQTPSMTYEHPANATKARLYVKEDGREYVYVGRNFNTILERYPAVRENESFALLKNRVAAARPVRLEIPEDADPRPVYQVEYWYMPEDVVIRTWKWSDGSWQKAEYRGADLSSAYESLRVKDPTLGDFIHIDIEATQPG